MVSTKLGSARLPSNILSLPYHGLKYLKAINKKKMLFLAAEVLSGKINQLIVEKRSVW